ncbi:hypothetical protein BDV3_002989 [Batrachochytrium dendrobatidis]
METTHAAQSDHVTLSATTIDSNDSSSLSLACADAYLLDLNQGSTTVMMPVAVMRRIINYLPSACDRLSLLSLNRQWSLLAAASIYASPLLATSQSFERLLQLLSSPASTLIHPYSSLISTLDLSSSAAADSIFMGDLDLVLSRCPQLLCFRMKHCFHISNILVRSLSANCINLRQVDLPGCPSITDTFIPTLTTSCPNLEILDLAFTNVTLISLYNIISNCPSIVELNLTECKPAATSISNELMQIDFSRPLYHLNLRNSAVTDTILRFIAIHCPSLTELILESCINVTDNGAMKIINTCPLVEVLDCSFCEKITDVTLQVIAIRASATSGGKLQELHLTGCDRITPASILQLVQKCSMLELLVLDGCDQLCGSYIQNMATYHSDDIECTFEKNDLVKLAGYDPTCSSPTSEHLSGTTEPTLVSNCPTTPPLTPPCYAKQEDLQYVENTLTGSTEMGRSWKGLQSTMPEHFSLQPSTITSLAYAVTVSYSIKTNPDHSAHGLTRDPIESVDSSTSQSLKTSPRRTSRALQSRRSTTSFTASTDTFDQVEAALYERVEKIREKRRSVALCTGITHQSFEPLDDLDSNTVTTDSNQTTRQYNLNSKSVSKIQAQQKSFISKRSSGTAVNGWKSSVSTTNDCETTNETIASSNDTVDLNTSESIKNPVVAGLDSYTTEIPAQNALLGSGRRSKSMRASAIRAAPFIPIGSPSSAVVDGMSTTNNSSDSTIQHSCDSNRQLFKNHNTPTLEHPRELDSGMSGQRTLLASGRRNRHFRTESNVEHIRAHSNDGDTGHCMSTDERSNSTCGWGADPQAWTNPTLHTSSNSAWRVAAASANYNQRGSSNADASEPLSMVAASPVFVDPWGSSQSGSRVGMPSAPTSHRMSLPAVSRSSWGDTAGHATSVSTRFPDAPAGWLRSQGNESFSKHTRRSSVCSSGSSHSSSSTSWHSRNMHTPSPPASGHDHRDDQRAPRRGNRSGQHKHSGSAAHHPVQPKVFVYTPPKPRGPLLLNLQIETPANGVDKPQCLSVHALDDPQHLAAAFCAFWGMIGFTEALRKVILLRKRSVGQGHLSHNRQGRTRHERVEQ